MANTLTNVMGKILARAMPALRSRCGLIQLVNSDFGMEVAKSGDTINVPLTENMTAQAVVPGVTAATPANLVPGTVPVVLDKWYQNPPISMTDADLQKIDGSTGYLPEQLIEGIHCIASAINQDIMSYYYKVGMWWKNATSIFNDVTDATNPRALLNANRAPRDNRAGVLDFDAEAAALKLAAFSDTSQVAGEKSAKFDGEIGRKFGILWVADDDIVSQVQGAVGAGALTVNGNHAAGLTTVSIAKAAGANWAAKKGDLIHIAGEASSNHAYSIMADVTITQGANTDVTISPALREAKASGDAITPSAGTSAITYKNCLIFHRKSFAFANRPLTVSAVDYELGNKLQTVIDPLTGLALRLELKRLHKMTVWEFDVLWGANCVRPDHCIRLIH